MKYVWLILCFALGGAMSASADQANDVSRLRDLVSQAESKARSFGVRDADGLMDAFPELYRKAEFVALQNEMSESWAIALKHMDEVAPTDMKKAVAFNSSGSMSESSFLAFLNAVADLVEKGMLDRKYLEWAQFSLESHLSGFLVKHHDQPEVRDIILRSRKIFEDIPGKVASYDAMLTGESKKKIENYEARLAPPSSDQMTRHESDGKRPASNRVTSPPMGDERTSIEPGGSSVGNELSLPSPPPPTPVRRANGFVWPMLGVAMAFLAAVAVWLLRRR